MGDASHTTTIEVKGDTYKALDRLRDQGESFDDAVTTLIENTAAGMDGFTADAPTVETGEIEEIPVGERNKHACAHVDGITGDMCEGETVYRQSYSFGPEDDGSEFYYCEEHAPTTTK